MAEEETQKLEEKKEKKDFLKLIMVISQILILLLVVAIFVYFKFFFSLPTVPATVESQEKIKKQEESTVQKQVISHLDPFVVNLLDEGGRRFLKVTIDLVVESEKVSKEIGERLPEIRDLIIVCLSDKSFNEISDQMGKMRLRNEIKQQLNSILTTGKVTKVLFTEFVVQ